MGALVSVCVNVIYNRDKWKCSVTGSSLEWVFKARSKGTLSCGPTNKYAKQTPSAFLCHVESKPYLWNQSRPHRYIYIWCVSRSAQTSALAFDTISTSVKRPKLTAEELSELPVWSGMALQGRSGNKSAAALSVSVDWLMRAVGGRDKANGQRQIIPSCRSSRARHENIQLTQSRGVRWGERSEVTGVTDKGEVDRHMTLTWRTRRGTSSTASKR